MKIQSLCTAVALAVSLAAPAHATDVTGTVTPTDSFQGFMGVLTNIVTSPEPNLLPSSAFSFCIEHDTQWPQTWFSTQSYTLGYSFAPYLSTPGSVDKATAMLNYVIDNYYEPLMQGNYGAQAGHGLNLAIWQITDFDGTRASMQVEATDPDFDPYGNSLYVAIMTDVYNHFDSISPSYRSSSYNFAFLQQHDSALQSVGVITPVTSPVPESSTLALTLAGGLVLVLRAKRDKPNA